MPNITQIVPIGKICSQNFDFPNLKNSYPGQFLNQLKQTSLNFETSCCILKIIRF